MSVPTPLLREPLARVLTPDFRYLRGTQRPVRQARPSAGIVCQTGRSTPCVCSGLVIIEDCHLRAALLRSDVPVQWETGSVADISISQQNSYELLLLDSDILPCDGLDALHFLRRERYAGHIMVLSSIASRPHRIATFNAGADAYIAKPYAVEEVLAWVRALLRRPTSVRFRWVYRHLTVNMLTSVIEFNGRRISLTPMAFSLLRLLAENRRRVVSRQTISRRLFSEPLSARQQNLIEAYVYRLRRELDLPGSESLIQTVRGIGYALR